MRHVGALVETPSLMMPLLIALETALLNGIEHSDSGNTFSRCRSASRCVRFESRSGPGLDLHIIAIHTWVSTRWSGFPIPLGAGIGGTFFALFAASASLAKYYPWLLPMNLFIDGRFKAALVLGIAGGIVATLAGCFEFVRRDVI